MKNTMQKYCFFSIYANFSLKNMFYSIFYVCFATHSLHFVTFCAVFVQFRDYLPAIPAQPLTFCQHIPHPADDLSEICSANSRDSSKSSAMASIKKLHDQFVLFVHLSISASKPRCNSFIFSVMHRHVGIPRLGQYGQFGQFGQNGHNGHNIFCFLRRMLSDIKSTTAHLRINYGAFTCH